MVGALSRQVAALLSQLHGELAEDRHREAAARIRRLQRDIARGEADPRSLAADRAWLDGMLADLLGLAATTGSAPVAGSGARSGAVGSGDGRAG